LTEYPSPGRLLPSVAICSPLDALPNDMPLLVDEDEGTGVLEGDGVLVPSRGDPTP
jgi:hypothetical protein